MDKFDGEHNMNDYLSQLENEELYKLGELITSIDTLQNILKSLNRKRLSLALKTQVSFGSGNSYGFCLSEIETLGLNLKNSEYSNVSSSMNFEYIHKYILMRRLEQSIPEKAPEAKRKIKI